MATLTQAFIKSLGPRKNKYTVSDTGTGSVSGLRIVVQPSGWKSWAVYYDTGKTMLNGRKQKKTVTLGYVDTISLDSARQQAREIIEQTSGATAHKKRENVRKFEEERSEVDFIKPNIKELFEEYLKDREAEGTKVIHNIRGYLINRMSDNLLSMEAREVRMSDIEEALDASFKSDSSWNMALSYVKAAFGYVRGTAKVRNHFGLPDYNPIADIRKKRIQIKTGYIPTLEDLAALWVECENYMSRHSANLTRAIIAGVGSRPSEIQQRKWDDLQSITHDGKHVRLLVMPETKMNKPHSIVCNDLMWECIKEADHLKEHASKCQKEFIFPSYSLYVGDYASVSGIGNSIRRARAAGAIANPVTIKHVRHAFSTIMGDNGVKADVIARCQNHSLGSAVNERHYGRSVFIAEKLEGSLKWNELLTKAIDDYRTQKRADQSAEAAA
ncbi:tyrosine-type recombinase/integrase [Litoribrevibacter euphylliae]|uniref:Tyrosine-type recombinase/integrase n=1 Tax=Litoribrevibacter euphylliae TaxID=1834034 RepID=A0ABV7HCA3_9GAMM